MLIKVNYSFKYFKELTGNELYNILYLRSLVFVVEQNCPYLDVDQQDKDALHLMLFEQETLSAYARILPPNKTSPNPKIGRVVVHPDFRRKKLGQKLMNLSIERCSIDYPGADIKISAQGYLKQFYQNLGFKQEGEEYLEDNIPHIGMRRMNTSTQNA